MYIHSRGCKFRQIFFKFGSNIPYFNSLDKFDGLNRYYVIPVWCGGGGWSPKKFVGGRIVLDEISVLIFVLLDSTFNGSFEPVCDCQAYFVQLFYKENMFRLV